MNKLEKIVDRTVKGVDLAALGLLGLGASALTVFAGAACALNLYRAVAQQDLESAAKGAFAFAAGSVAFYAANVVARTWPSQAKNYISNFKSGEKLPEYVRETAKAFGSDIAGRVACLVSGISKYAGGRK